MAKYYSLEKINRMKRKAEEMPIEYLKTCYKNNLEESKRCIETNKIILDVIERRSK